MALQMDRELEGTGIAVSDAYMRVEAMGVPQHETLSFRLRSYTAAEGVSAFDDRGFQCPYDWEGENVFKQAYEWLKEQPDFDGAQDV